MKHSKRARRGKRGFTSLEVLISTAILGMLMGGVSLIMHTSLGAYREAQLSAELEGRLRRAVDRVAQELVSTGADVITPDPSGEFGSSTLEFRRAIGLTGDVVNWGSRMNISFDYEAGEIDDGVDNNGNGLVDEGVLALDLNVGAANEKRVVICHGVSELGEGEAINLDDDNGNGVKDEAGFNVRLEDDVLVLRLTLEAIDRNGTLVQRSVETGVRFRN